MGAVSIHKLHVTPSAAAGEEGDARPVVNYLTDQQAAGDYYTEQNSAPMWWVATDWAARMLGLELHGEPRRKEIELLLQGCEPLTGERIRRAGSNGQMVGGIDVTVSPVPKSVSVLWALAGPTLRRELEGIVITSVNRAMHQMLAEEALARERYGRGPKDFRPVVADEYAAVSVLHTTARLAEGAATPDPQLHVHTVLFGGVEMRKGKLALKAYDSRAVMKYQARLGAVAGGHAAELLRQRGFGIERHEVRNAAGHVQRVAWELAGIPSELVTAFSQRSNEVEDLKRQYEEEFGRSWQEGAAWDKFFIAHRGPKVKLTKQELYERWVARAEEHGWGRAELEALEASADQATAAGVEERDRKSEVTSKFKELLLAELCRENALVTDAELDKAKWQLAEGLIGPHTASRAVADLFGDGDLVGFKDGTITTLAVLAAEQRTERAAGILLDEPRADGGEEDVEQELARRRRDGRPLGEDQEAAVRLAVAGGRLVSITGPAGTGKGYAAEAMTSIWRARGRRVIALAVAGRTAQQAGEDARADQAWTLDGLRVRLEHEVVQLRPDDVLLVDEAGMVDHQRYADLLEAAAESGATVVQIGDAAQLSPVAPGGLWTVTHEMAEARGQAAELEEVRRARDPREAEAWSDLREGRTERALLWYREVERLNLYETRRELLGGMVAAWWQDTEHQDAEKASIPLMVVDTSNAERDELNRLAQERRLEAGQLGAEAVEMASGRPLRAGDQVIFNAIHAPDWEAGERWQRVENGTVAAVVSVDTERNTAELRLHEASGERTFTVDRSAPVELGYARHVSKAQGVTVNTADLAISDHTARNGLYVMASRARSGARIHALYADLQEMAEEGAEQARSEPPADFAFRAREAAESAAEYEQARREEWAQQRVEEPAYQVDESGERSSERQTLDDLKLAAALKEARYEREREQVTIGELGQQTQREATKHAVGHRESEAGLERLARGEVTADREEARDAERASTAPEEVLDRQIAHGIAGQGGERARDREAGSEEQERQPEHSQEREQAAHEAEQRREATRQEMAAMRAERYPSALLAREAVESLARAHLEDQCRTAGDVARDRTSHRQPLERDLVEALALYEVAGRLDVAEDPVGQAVERLRQERGSVLIAAGAEDERAVRERLAEDPELAQLVDAQGRLQSGRQAYEERQQRREAWLGQEPDSVERRLGVEPGSIERAYVLSTRPEQVRELTRATSAAVESHLIIPRQGLIDEAHIQQRSHDIQQRMQERAGVEARDEPAHERAVEYAVHRSAERSAGRRAERTAEPEAGRS